MQCSFRQHPKTRFESVFVCHEHMICDFVETVNVGLGAVLFECENTLAQLQNSVKLVGFQFAEMFN